MKKIHLLLLTVMFLCFMFTSCDLNVNLVEKEGQHKAEEPVVLESRENGDTQNIENDTCIENDGQQINEHDTYIENDSQQSIEDNTDIDIDEPSNILTDYNDYCEYIDNNAKLLPEDFVSYEQLASLGEFQCLTFSIASDHSYYIYDIKTSDGFLITAFIKHDDMNSSNISTEEITVLQSKPANLLQTSSYKSQKVSYKNIQYTYNSDGELRYVSTHIGDIKLTFSPGAVYDVDTNKFVYMRFADYKSVSENILVCLLSGNEKNASIDLFLTNPSG